MRGLFRNAYKHVHIPAALSPKTLRLSLAAISGGILVALLNALLVASVGRAADEVVEGVFLFVLVLAGTWGWHEWRVERRQHQRLAQLRTLTEQINTPFELNDVLQTVVDLLVDALRVDHGAVALLADDELTLRVVVERRGPQSESTVGMQIPCGDDTPLAPLVRDRRELVVPDVLRAPLLNEFLSEVFQKRRSRAFLAVPLVSDQRAIGIVGLHVSSAPRDFLLADIQLAKDLAAVAANAAQKARLLAEERRRNAQLVVINTVAQLLVGQHTRDDLTRLVVQTLAQRFGWIAGLFWLDAEQDELALQAADFGAQSHQLDDKLRLKVGQGIVGWVAEHNQSLLVRDVRQDSRYVAGDGNARTLSELAVPVCAGGLLLGVLNVESEQAAAFDHDDMIVLQEIAADAGAALLNVKFAEQIQEALAVQTKLLDASGRISAQQHVDAVLNSIMANAREVIGADQCSIMLIDTQGYCYRWVGVGYAYSLDPHVMRREGISMRVVRTGQAVFIDDVARSPEVNPRMRAEGIRSTACLPLQSKTAAHGVFWAQYFSQHRLAQEEQAVLQTFANHAAIAIEQAKSVDELRHHVYELETLNRISAELGKEHTPAELYQLLLDEVLAMLDLTIGGIWVGAAGGRELRMAAQRGMPEHTRALGVGEGVIGRVVATGEAWTSSDLKRDPQIDAAMREAVADGLSGAAVPILAGEQVIGAFAVGAPSSGSTTQQQLRFMTTVTKMAGVAIQRAHLHEKNRRQLLQLNALHRIDLAISASTEIRTTLDFILAQALAQLHVDAADVLLFNTRTQTLEYAAGRGFHSGAIDETPVRPGQGYAGQVALSRHMIRVADLRTDAGVQARRQWLKDENFVAYFGAPLIAKDQVKGVIEVFQRAHFTPDPEWLEFLEAFATQTAIGIDSAEMFQGLQESIAELMQAYEATIEGWSRALDLRDKETEGHTQRVTTITVDLARAMGTPDSEIVHIRRGALLHDIGKIAVPDTILLKPGPLTDEEWRVMRLHPQHAYEMLAPIAYLRAALDIPYCHHEKWDGSGYPRGLKGEQIPLSARIFAVVDVADALGSDRPYRSAWPAQRVRQYVREQSGIHFDPAVVEAYLALNFET